jgi:hypothetical protein
MPSAPRGRIRTARYHTVPTARAGAPAPRDLAGVDEDRPRQTVAELCTGRRGTGAAQRASARHVQNAAKAGIKGLSMAENGLLDLTR